MAVATAFVDDVVLNRLPRVCAKTGQPATRTHYVTATVAGTGFAWLLLLLGPPGWIVFALVMAFGRETITARIPVSADALQTIRQWRWAARIALGGAVLALLLLVVTRLAGFALLALAILAVAGICHLGASFASVGVRIDGSRRWVTITGTSDEFAAAVIRHRDAALDRT